MKLVVLINAVTKHSCFLIDRTLSIHINLAWLEICIGSFRKLHSFFIIVFSFSFLVSVDVAFIFRLVE